MNRAICFFLSIVATVFFLGGCDFVYRMVDKEGAQEKDLLGEVVPFEQNFTVKEVQTLLTIYGYNAGRVDGKLGNQTRNAIERFQTDSGLKVTRFVDEATWAQLKIFKDYTLVEDNQLNIRLIQEILKAAECYSGKVDGKFGKKSIEAVKKFQKLNGLKADGRIGYKTLAAMTRYLVFE